MTEVLQCPLADLAQALRRRDISVSELIQGALERHEAVGRRLGAYREVDREGAKVAARVADALLAKGGEVPPLCGIPVSVKDLYGVKGTLTFAGSPRSLPPRWAREGWLVGRVRDQGAILLGKTHTVEFAYGALGINPHWGTPRNPWDDAEHRVPGGSSAGAGVSLVEGSALVALGTDTGGSIRIPASMTGTVGFRTTTGRWPTDGVVPLSPTLDVVGSLTRSVADLAYVFGSLDPRWGSPEGLRSELRDRWDGRQGSVRMGIPECGVWEACGPGIRRVLERTVEELTSAGWEATRIPGEIIEEAEDAYLASGLAGAEGRAFLESELPEWIPLLDPIVGERIEGAPVLDSEEYRRALHRRRNLRARAPELMAGVDVLALPGATFTPPPLQAVKELSRYAEANIRALRPTCSAAVLDLPALTLPVGLDEAGMPVGLQLLGRSGEDEALLSAALTAEEALGTPKERIGLPEVRPR